jgi:small-conductance mechanosensitive channel
VGIGFGLQNIVSNFVSGLILLFERPIEVGDILNIEGQWGTVEKMGLRSTIIRSVTKAEIIIPNSDFVTRKVENLTFSDPDHRFSVKVSTEYGSDAARVLELLVAIAEAHADVSKETTPEAYFMEFGESALQFELFAWTKNLDGRRRIMSDLLTEIDRRFRAEGINIPFPQRDLHLRSIDGRVLAADGK